MNNALNVARSTAAIVGFAATAAFAQLDVGGENHYILNCDAKCQDRLARTTIDSTFTGAWFDPAQSGHGLFVEVLSDSRIQVAWFTFNPAGTEQAWFMGTGTYVDNKATISGMVQPAGGRWVPNFDPGQVVNSAWGTLTITFADAQHGKAEFNSTVGYGSGYMNLTRLTNPTAASDPNWVRTGALNVGRVGHAATLLPNGTVLVVGGAVTDPDGNGQLYPTRDDTAELFYPNAGTWIPTGRLNESRGLGITTTLLRDGSVLLAGGACVYPGQGVIQYCGTTSSAELYDATAGTWRFTGSMGSPRYEHSATLLANGKVLVAGGRNSLGTIASAELFDPATGTWTPTGALNSARNSHRAALLPDGKVLVVGGNGEPWSYDELVVPSSEIYDPVTGKWNNDIGSPDVLAYSLGAPVPLRDGKVIVAGGVDYSTGPQGEVWTTLDRSTLFDPATSAWILSDSLASARTGHATNALANGDVLVTGGYDFLTYRGLASAERYDARTRKWSSAGKLNSGRWDHSATLLADGRVLLAGGVQGTNGRYTSLREAELYVDETVQVATIRPGFTGAWYNPAQSGHGLFIEVLPENRFLAAWFAFNPAGTAQAWFIGVGTYSGNTATISKVIQPTGGAWIPNFDANRIANDAWGSLTFTFSDCSHGKVDFNSTAGYGSGSMNLTRLTQPEGLTCP